MTSHPRACAHDYQNSFGQLRKRISAFTEANPDGMVHTLFDTGGISILYNALGENAFSLPEPLGRNERGDVILTTAVLDELNAQRDASARADNGEQLAPYQLLGSIYTRLSLGEMHEESVVVTTGALRRMRHALRLGTVDNNYRLGAADASLIAFAQEHPEDLSIIVSCDSDIPSTLAGLDMIAAKHLVHRKPERAKQSLHGGLYLHPNNLISYIEGRAHHD